MDSDSAGFYVQFTRILLTNIMIGAKITLVRGSLSER